MSLNIMHLVPNILSYVVTTNSKFGIGKIFLVKGFIIKK